MVVNSFIFIIFFFGLNQAYYSSVCANHARIIRIHAQPVIGWTLNALCQISCDVRKSFHRKCLVEGFFKMFTNRSLTEEYLNSGKKKKRLIEIISAKASNSDEEVRQFVDNWVKQFQHRWTKTKSQSRFSEREKGWLDAEVTVSFLFFNNLIKRRTF